MAAVTEHSLDIPGNSTQLLIRIMKASPRRSVQRSACPSPGAGATPGHLMILREVVAIFFMN
jgi:hypothetical protein